MNYLFFVGNFFYFYYYYYYYYYYFFYYNYYFKISGAKRLVLIQFHLVKYRLFNISVIDAFYRTVKRKANKIGFRINDESWTFEQMDVYSNRVANYFQSLGYRKGKKLIIS